MPKVEKTTLGDLSALAELKASMEAEEKPAKKATMRGGENKQRLFYFVNEVFRVCRLSIRSIRSIAFDSLACLDYRLD